MNEEKEASASDPIRKLEDIQKIKEYFKENNYKYYLLFLIGINTGLRVSDILLLKEEDFDNNIINVKEQKTSKKKQIYINDNLLKEIQEYIKRPQFHNTGYLFDITRSPVYKMFNKVFKDLNVDIINIGTHTMRKTFGYHHYKRFKDIAILQKIFNHSSQDITLRYIGVEQEEILNSLKQFIL